MLLLYENHYCLIRNLNRLIADQRQHEHTGYYCPKCLIPVYERAKYQPHVDACQNDQMSRIVMPKEGKNILQFRNFHRQLRCPVVVYADTECLTKKIPTCPPDPSTSYTIKYQFHEPYSYGLIVAKSCGCPGTETEFERLTIFRGPNPIEEFLRNLIDIANEYHQTPMHPIRMSMADEISFDSQLGCSLCQEPLRADRVRDHCHICGNYRGALHRQCNQSLRLNRDVVIVFHNLRKYDGHFIIKELGRFCRVFGFYIECIARGTEDYVTFSLKKSGERWQFRFVDSFQFLASSLENLAKQLNNDDFHSLNQHFDQNIVPLMRRNMIGSMMSPV